jgi:hypothetical protein
VPAHLTVGHLLRQLQQLSPELPVRLAINPDWPFAHTIAAYVVERDGVAYIAEDGQEGHLPPAVRAALDWE